MDCHFGDWHQRSVFTGTEVLRSLYSYRISIHRHDHDFMLRHSLVSHSQSKDKDVALTIVMSNPSSTQTLRRLRPLNAGHVTRYAS